MRKNVHIIQKQRYEIKCRKQKTAMDMQRRIDDINTRYFLPALSLRLDKHFSADEMVEFDKIEIDLGRVSSRMDNDEWAERIFEKLDEQLSSALVLGHEKKTGMAGHGAEVWTWFLRHGMLPAGSIYNSVSEIITELKLINPGDKELIRSFLYKEVDSDVLKRLVLSTDVEMKKWHMQLFFSQNIDHLLIELQKEIGTILDLSNDKLVHLAFVWEKILGRVIRNANGNNMSDTELFEVVKATTVEMNRKFAAHDKETESLADDKKDELIQNNKTNLPVSEIFITNAGLCLLAPWINSFFRQLKLVDGNEFVDIKKQEHAVFLLHYLVTREEYPTEEVLIFPKLLCGCPLQMPVMNSYAITDEEKKECGDLLTSVIQNWNTLKNTSIEGLMGSFLQRGGKLVEGDEHFILQPEQQSIDLLLEYVPWTFRYIRLPWMTKAVQVEWY